MMSAYETLRHTIGWLHDDRPMNVLMPCKKGTKFPSFPHVQGAWDWDKCGVFLRKNTRLFKEYDIGILLHDLCVVDIDDDDIRKEFETTYPVLKSVPMEETKNGAHYFFLRSEKCDSHGYYDGARQIRQGIDFKTRTQVGTSGFLVVSPSTDKTWIRAPWNAENEMICIPDDLLDAVAVPRHVPMDFTLTFPDDRDEKLVITSKQSVWMCSIFRTILESFEGDNLTFPIYMFSKSVFQDLLFALNHGGVTTNLPTIDRCEELRRLSDYIGVPPYQSKSVFSTGGYSHGMIDISRDLGVHVARMMHDEALYRTGKLVLSELKRVHSESTRVTDLPSIPNRMLFGTHTDGLPQIERIVRTRLSIPNFAVSWLEEFEGRLVLAGGAALHAVVEDIPVPKDYDFFVIDRDDDEITSKGIVAIISSKPGVDLMCVTKNAATFLVEDKYVAQIILRRYESGYHLLTSFDIAPCKVLVRVQDGRTISECTPVWEWSMQTSCAPISFDTWGSSSYARILKYSVLRFRFYIPCIERSKFRDNLSRSTTGIARLFAFEQSRRYARSSFPRSNEVASEIQKTMKKNALLRMNDYNTYKRLVNSTIYLFKWLSRSNPPKKGFSTELHMPYAPTSSVLYATSLDWHELHK